MGLELESAYGYTAQDGKCKAKESLEKVLQLAYNIRFEIKRK